MSLYRSGRGDGNEDNDDSKQANNNNGGNSNSDNKSSSSKPKAGIDSNSNSTNEAKKISINLKLKATNGVMVSSETVFVGAFDQIRKEVQRALQKMKLKDSTRAHEIQYILTVPAIWDETAKHYMRGWATKAGLVNGKTKDQLRIVYEPDCASLTLQYEMKRNSSNSSGEDNAEFAKGDKYILIDAGGGTCDIACHEILGDLNNNEFGVEEILHPSGGAWGSAYIDQEYLKLLDKIFSPKWMNDFRDKSPKGVLEILDEFRNAKVLFKDDAKVTFNVNLSMEFLEFIETRLEEEDNDEDTAAFAEKFSFENETGLVSMDDEYLTLDNRIWRSMFDVVVQPIIDHCKQLLKHTFSDNQQWKHLCLVGGLSCNEYFRKSITEAFGPQTEYKLNILTPKRPMLCVVEGAALLGVTPNYIRARVLTKTYGILLNDTVDECRKRCISEEFIAANLINDGKEVDNCFIAFVRKNDAIYAGQGFQISTYRQSSDQKESTFYIYCSDMEHPLTKEDGQQLAEYTITYDENNKNLESVTEFQCGGTLLKVLTYPKNEPDNKKEVQLKF